MRLVLLGCVLLVLSGCSWLVNDHDNDYLKSDVQPNIVIPKDIAAIELKPQFQYQKWPLGHYQRRLFYHALVL